MNKKIVELENVKQEFLTNVEDISKILEEYKTIIEKQQKEKQIEEIKLEIGNIKALKVFKNTKDFNEFTENLYNIKKWTIRQETYKERATVLKNYSYWNELKTLFQEKDLTNRNITDNQLVSFFDTMYLMYLILNDINHDSIKNEMQILMEYRIPIPSRPRIDFLLCYRNNILLLEFSKADNSNNLSKTANNKILQLAQYRENLSNIIGLDYIKINSEVCVYLPEVSEENIQYNNESIDQVKKTIIKTFEKQKNAFEYLQEND